MLKELLSNTSWLEVLKDETNKDYFKTLDAFLQQEYDTKTIYPAKANLFRALELTEFENIKVVILGQDPYHGKDQATGLAFSVPLHVKSPPSLKNILKELMQSSTCRGDENVDLSLWAKQGVLLINAIMSVEASCASSHSKRGWETLTDKIIKLISEKKEHVVFILWGTYAQKKALLIDENRHLVIKSAHPSPLSAYRGFFGSKPFERTNEYLFKNSIKPIIWC